MLEVSSFALVTAQAIVAGRVSMVGRRELRTCAGSRSWRSSTTASRSSGRSVRYLRDISGVHRANQRTDVGVPLDNLLVRAVRREGRREHERSNGIAALIGTVRVKLAAEIAVLDLTGSAEQSRGRRTLTCVWSMKPAMMA